MSALTFLILALATWRIASLVAVEEGPGDIFVRLRHLIGIRYGEGLQSYGSNAFARGVMCVWCNSIWFGTIWAVAYWLWPDVWWLALPLALSAVAAIVERWVSP